MSWLDIAIIGVVLGSIVWGVWRGLVREVMSLAGWVIAFLAAQRGGRAAGRDAAGVRGSPEVRVLNRLHRGLRRDGRRGDAGGRPGVKNVQGAD